MKQFVRLCLWSLVLLPVFARASEPVKLPYVLYPWDHLQWGEEFGHTPDVAFPAMKECCFSFPGFVQPQDVDLCEKNGFSQCFVTLDRAVSQLRLGTLTQEEADEFIAREIASTKDDPRVIGYFFQDEPGAGKFSGLGKLVQALKKQAPEKLAYINLYPNYASTGEDSQMQTDSYQEYLERFVQEVDPPFISYDNYQVEYSEDMKNEDMAQSYWHNLIDVHDVALKYNRPWWNIVSSLTIRPEGIPIEEFSIAKSSTPPTIPRLAFQAYTSLAAGAEGLSWYLFYPLGTYDYAPIDKEGRKTLTFLYLREINEQVMALGTFLLDYRSADVWFSEPTPVENLPTNPGNLLKKVVCQWPKDQKKEREPSIMVGQFEKKEGTGSAFMVVNLDFAEPIHVTPEGIDPEKNFIAISPVDGKPMKDPIRGWWVLPGHGILFVEAP